MIIIFNKNVLSINGLLFCNFEDGTRIDIAKIRKINLRPRLFCILDRDKPYTLDIYYENPHLSVGYGNGIVVHGDTRLNDLISIRGTSDELSKFHTELSNQMTTLERLSEKCRKDILKELNG